MSALVALTDIQAARFREEFDSPRDTPLWVADWLAHLGMFTDLQICDIVKYVMPALEHFATHETDYPQTIAVGDSRWISAAGIDGFLDVETNKPVKELADFCVTHIICDINALIRRMRYRSEKFSGVVAGAKPCQKQTADNC